MRAISYTEVISTMNDALKVIDNKSFASENIIKFVKNHYPNINMNEIQFNGNEFYLQYKEHILPVGIEFYETIEDEDHCSY